METESSIPAETLKPGLSETSPLVREIAAVLIASGRTLSIHAIASACRRTTEEVREAVETLKAKAGELGLRVVELSPAGVQVLVDGTYRRTLRALNPESTPSRAKLSPEAAETLALLQDRGPMTVGEIKAWRGCNARNAIKTLEKIGFVAPAGRAKGRGGPIRYEATAMATLIKKSDEPPPGATDTLTDGVGKEASKDVSATDEEDEDKDRYLIAIEHGQNEMLLVPSEKRHKLRNRQRPRPGLEFAEAVVPRGARGPGIVSGWAIGRKYADVGEEVYTFKVRVTWRPAASRTIEILESQTFKDLHDAIQEAFGWGNDHGYFFDTRSGKFAAEHLRNGGEGSAAETKLAKLTPVRGERMLYVYDMGDCLEHLVTCQKIRRAEERVKYPRTTARKGKPKHPWRDEEEEEW